MMEFHLKDHVAVVSGATSDIGRSIWFRLVSAGARVCLLGRDIGSLERMVAEAPAGPAQTRCYAVDLTEEATLVAFGRRLGDEVGRADILIHSGGAYEMAPHADAHIADLDLLYRTNVRGPYLLTQTLLPLLRAHRGQIVFLNSTVGLEARAGVGQYASTQHALRGIADALRAEVNVDGIRVLSVFLGRTATSRQARIFEREGRPYAPSLLMQPDDVAHMVIAALGLPRTAEVTELRMRPLVKSY
jgi:NADP-dependent 3-hydroxy acid dehydrogenase YdfG